MRARVQQDLLRALILQKNPAGSEAGAGSEAVPQILFEAEASAPVETEADLRSLTSVLSTFSLKTLYK